MAKCRSMLVFVLVLSWTAISALVCLPNATMTQAEMACCKKMAGDCHMSAGEHPCCKTKVEQPTPVGTPDRTTIHIQYVVTASSCVRLLAEPTLDRKSNRELRGLPPPAPPGLSSVLRI
jgi:hypothetical protein